MFILPCGLSLAIGCDVLVAGCASSLASSCDTLACFLKPSNIVDCLSFLCGGDLLILSELVSLVNKIGSVVCWSLKRHTIHLVYRYVRYNILGEKSGCGQQ